MSNKSVEPTEISMKNGIGQNENSGSNSHISTGRTMDSTTTHATSKESTSVGRAIIQGGLEFDNPEESSSETSNSEESSNPGTVYIAPVEDPYDKAMTYYSKHNIIELFQGLTAGLVFNRPEDPLQFMIDEVEKIQEKEKYKKHEIRKEDTENSQDNT